MRVTFLRALRTTHLHQSFYFALPNDRGIRPQRKENQMSRKKPITPVVTVNAVVGMPVRFQAWNYISECYEQALGEVKELLPDGRMQVKYYNMTLHANVRPCDVLEALKAKPYWA